MQKSVFSCVSILNTEMLQCSMSCLYSTYLVGKDTLLRFQGESEVKVLRGSDTENINDGIRSHEYSGSLRTQILSKLIIIASDGRIFCIIRIILNQYLIYSQSIRVY